MAPPSSRAEKVRVRRKQLAFGAVAAMMSTALVGCGGGSDSTVLTWYINPDAGGQDAVAEKCSTDEYTIDTQVLPQDASQQRIQLARRLAAGDPGIDLMSLDPPYTAEFANAGYLASIPQDLATKLEEQSFDGATEAATWDGELVAAPFWSNTQVLWYRKSFVDKIGMDMNEPVTWQQIIDAASENGGKVAVQANKYEGYSVWINALIAGAGGSIVENAEEGVDATAKGIVAAGGNAVAQRLQVREQQGPVERIRVIPVDPPAFVEREVGVIVVVRVHELEEAALLEGFSAKGLRQVAALLAGLGQAIDDLQTRGMPLGKLEQMPMHAAAEGRVEIDKELHGYRRVLGPKSRVLRGGDVLEDVHMGHGRLLEGRPGADLLSVGAACTEQRSG